MARVKQPEPPAAPDDPGPIPDALLVQNRKPPTKEQQVRIDAAKAKAKALADAYDPDPKRWDKPKGMTDEEYDAWKNRERLEKNVKIKERLKLRPSKPPKAEAPKDTFRLTAWAREIGLEDRLVRIVARANKDRLQPLETFGKYVYPNSAKEQVSKIIHEGLSKKKKPEPKLEQKKAKAKKVAKKKVTKKTKKKR
jgi:hypothetical protein